MGPDGKVADSVLGTNEILLGRARPALHSQISSFVGDRLDTPEFRHVLDLVPAMIWVSAPDTKCTYLNRPWLEFTGRTLEQELGDGWAECVHPEDRKSSMDSYLSAVRDRRTFLIEYRLRRRDGAYRWLLDTGVPICGADGRFFGYIGSCIDITEHKQTDAVLQETEELYRSVVTAMSEGVVVTDDAGVIQLCNASAERIVGLSAREVIGRPVKDSRWGAIHEDGSTFSIDSFPVVVTLATGRPCSNVVMGLPRPSGGVAWISINTQPLLGDRGRLSSGVVATIADITERKLAEQALHRAHEQLEHRVKERTAELENANARLRSEIGGRALAEQELKESEERYRIVLERAPDAIFLYDEDQILFANRQAAAFFGVAQPADLLGRAIWDFIDPKDQEPIRRRIVELKSQGGVLLSIETVLLRPDGTELAIETTATGCPYQGRTVIQVIARDISARNEAQEALRKSAEQISDLYNRAPCGYHSINAYGVVVRMNDTELNWLGYRREEVVGVKRIAELMTPGSKDVFDDRFPQFMETGLIRDVEFDLVRKDGSLLPVVLNATAVRDDKGRFVMSRSTVFDMTQLKRAGEALRESEERFRRLAEASSEGIAIHDGGTILDANETLARMFGYPRQELIGMTRTELVIPAMRGSERDPSDNSLNIADERPYETLGVRRDGSMFPIEIRGKVIPYQGRTAHVSAVRDLTDRKQIEDRARQHQAELARVLRLSTMGEMATGMAHELNQPLFAIINYTQGCLNRIESGSTSPAELARVLRQVTLQAGRAGDIIRRLRRFVGKHESQLGKVDINDVVREAVQFLTPEARGPGLTIDLELAEGLPEVEADMIQIEQVLLNLLRNACEALREMGQWPRRILVRTELGDRGMIEVAVHDNGPGLSAAVSERLFQPFFTTKAGGMGLGLSISKSIIEAHGGRLWATPNPDYGVTFRFSLPALGAIPRPAS